MRFQRGIELQSKLLFPKIFPRANFFIWLINPLPVNKILDWFKLFILNHFQKYSELLLEGANVKFYYPFIKPYIVGTHWNRLVKTIPMSTHNIGFGWEIKDLDCHHSLLSVALYNSAFKIAISCDHVALSLTICWEQIIKERATLS